MKLLTIVKGAKSSLGIKVDGGIIDVEETVQKLGITVPMSMEEVVLGGQAALSDLQKFSQEAQRQGHIVSEKTITFGPSVSKPEKVLCIGLNYKKHALETNTPFPTSPIVFCKFNNALAGHQDKIVLPDVASEFDYEAELVMVIGKETRNVSEVEALAHVFGYTIGNDLSARDAQFKTTQWLLGKTCDGFAPIGPYVVTADEICDPNDLTLETHVNGKKRQSGNTKDMIFSCASIISYLSKYMTLKPGDIIFTGTPSGVIMGYPEAEQVWLKPGDQVTITIEKLGELQNTMA